MVDPDEYYSEDPDLDHAEIALVRQGLRERLDEEDFESINVQEAAELAINQAQGLHTIRTVGQALDTDHSVAFECVAGTHEALDLEPEVDG
ncbi:MULTISPECIES: hypothetical protein [Halobacterium]|uniref:hypothetical protein n=1 Tax=Halobacterium TaxID=2239 RepID=UPI00073F8DA8|nr:MULTISPECIES: hypothetical protein [Halobacterium]MCG1001901.1 hypothetical protein [Halobacterium noricense]